MSYRTALVSIDNDDGSVHVFFRPGIEVKYEETSDVGMELTKWLTEAAEDAIPDISESVQRIAGAAEEAHRILSESSD